MREVVLMCSQGATPGIFCILYIFLTPGLLKLGYRQPSTQKPINSKLYKPDKPCLGIAGITRPTQELEPGASQSESMRLPFEALLGED